MSYLPSNPLQTLLTSAAQSLPTTTGRVAAQQERIDRRRGEVVILADISASMGTPVDGGRRKVDVLREAVGLALQSSNAKLWVFSGEARTLKAIPEPEGSTNLAGALEDIRALDPGVTLVISDGEPDNAGAALAAARKFRGVIDVLYIGPEENKAAIAFMRRLAQTAGGNVQMHDLGRLGSPQQLLGCIARLLK